SVIINASVGAHKGWPTTSTVTTCKAAVLHLARILSAELVDRGIRVNTLSPGPTDTAMFGRFPGEEQGDAVKDILRTNNPSKRMADPLEIAKLAAYLASDDSAYVVGADFLIDGGVTAISGVGRQASLRRDLRSFGWEARDASAHAQDRGVREVRAGALRSRGGACVNEAARLEINNAQRSAKDKEIGNEGTYGCHR